MSLSNYSLRDDIQDYWSARAATFDQQVGHEICSERERSAWHTLITRHLGPAQDRTVLDLACGTGVVSHLMNDLGFMVTGLDWSDAMLAKAREKSRIRGDNIRFLNGDAENTREPDASYDVIVMRHLVWTLVDPEAASRHWFRLLKPGGMILIVDGDFVRQTLPQRLLSWISRIVQADAGSDASIDRERHERILKQVYFSEGARADKVAALLQLAGFREITIQTDLRTIQRAQAKALGILKALQRRCLHRYVIGAKKKLTGDHKTCDRLAPNRS